MEAMNIFAIQLIMVYFKCSGTDDAKVIGMQFLIRYRKVRKTMLVRSPRSILNSTDPCIRIGGM